MYSHNYRTLWSCGLILLVLDWKVVGSNLANAKNIFQFKSTKISSQKSEKKKKGTLSLIALVRAVAVREEEVGANTITLRSIQLYHTSYSTIA